MKKLLLLVGTFLFLLTTVNAASEQATFLTKMETAIYYGSRSGKLTKREVRVLNSELSSYEKSLWKYQKNDKLSRREKRKLRKLADALNKKLDIALYNQERVYGAKKKGKAKVKKYKKGNRNNGPICRMPSKRTRINKM